MAHLTENMLWMAVWLCSTMMGPILGSPAVADDEEEWLVVETIATGLQGPAGVAVDPCSGTVFVAEPGAGRVLVFEGRTIVGALRKDFKVHGDSVRGPDRIARSAARLCKPEAIAFDSAGTFFVAESAPGGRLLAFNLHENAEPCARVVALASEVFDRGKRGGWEVSDAAPARPFPFARPHPAAEIRRRSGRRPASRALVVSAGHTELVREESLLARLAGPGSLGGLASHPVSGELYLALRAEGALVCVRNLNR